MNMELKVLICNCKGLCKSFDKANMNTLPFQIESELDVKYTLLHPQLCGQGGNSVLTEVLRESGPETHVVVGACAPEVQTKLFKRVLRATKFDEKRFYPVDIRGTDNDGIFDRIRSAVDGILKTEAAAETPRDVLASGACSQKANLNLEPIEAKPDLLSALGGSTHGKK
jgi:hypothetical protein